MRSISVLVADDHEIVRSGLVNLINRAPDMTVTAEAAGVSALLEAAEKCHVDVVILDLNMPGGGAVQTIAELRSLCPDARIIAFTAHDSRADVVVALKAGAAGFVAKRAPATQVLDGIRAVHSGRSFLSDGIDESVLDGLDDRDSPPSGSPTSLSRREGQILKLIAHGYTYPEIAAQLGIGVKSVETYRLRLNRKLGLRTRAELTSFVSHSALLERASNGES